MKKLIIILMFGTFMVSCNETNYWIIIDNRSEENISNVVVWYDSKVLSSGPVSVSANSSSTNAGSKPKLLDEMKITWEDSNKKPYEQVFKTFDFLPKDYNGGNVIFIYRGNGEMSLKFHMPKNDFPKLIDV
ncbi:MAG: hypothetical protein R3F25_08820 [Gammaproteobacteria bacterium]